MNYTASEENYLKAIFHLQEGQEAVTTNALAQKLKTSPASITDMTKRLSVKKLLHYKPYYGFTLTTEGKKMALSVVRRHRLWEYFLSQKLGISWEEIHSLAEELEHVSSKLLIDRLDEYLGFPSVDPHGDPIPDARGKMAPRYNLPLLKLPQKQKAVVCQVLEQSPEMLDLLKRKNITIGSKVEVRQHFDYDQSIELKINASCTTISAQLAKNILVTYEKDLV